MNIATNEDVEATDDNPKRPASPGFIRFVIVGLLFCMFAVQFGIRISLALAIIAMTSEGTSINPDVPYYDWDNSSIILSAFYWTYPILQFVAGHLEHHFGCKKLLLNSVFVASLAHILIPLGAAYAGSNGVIALRAIQGLCQGLIFPCFNGVLGRWLPPNELSVLYSLGYSGIYVGIILTKIFTGYLSASSLGWPTSFYILGAVGLVWCLLWMVLCTDTPATHPYIGLEERKYIEQTLDQEKDHMLEKKPSIPWSKVVRSLPYWAIVVGAIGSSWLSTFSSTQIASYMSYAVGLDIVKTGLISATSTGSSIVSVIVFGSIASYTLKRGWLSVVNSRRIFHALAHYTHIVLLLSLPFIESQALAMVFYIVTSLLAGAASSGHLVNSIDLSPRYASGLCGIANGTGQIVAILAPLLVQYMVIDKTDKNQWRNTFYLAAAVDGVAATFFIAFCSGERQWWDDVAQAKKNEDTELEDKKDNENHA